MKKSGQRNLAFVFQYVCHKMVKLVKHWIMKKHSSTWRSIFCSIGPRVFKATSHTRIRLNSSLWWGNTIQSFCFSEMDSCSQNTESTGTEQWWPTLTLIVHDGDSGHVSTRKEHSW